MMAGWLDTPLIVIALLAVVTLFWKFARWTGEVDSDRKTLKEVLNTIQDDIKKILGRLPPAPVQSGSPLRLTDFGEKLANAADAYRWARATAPALLVDVEGKQPFEVDEFCQEYVLTKLSSDMQRKVAMSAFDYGTDKKGVLSVLRVVLRDELLALLQSSGPLESTGS